MSMKDKAAVVGVGFTPYYRRGQSLPQTELEMACKAILAALDDAGLTIRDLDGFAIYSSSCDPAVVGFGGNPYAAMGISPSMAFSAGSGLMSPGNSFALLTRRHMELYGTKREHLAEVAISQRENAIPRETALQRVPLTLDDYFNARMISDPLCLFDYTMETDGAVAVITTSAERARDLRHPPVYIMAGARRSSTTSSSPTSTSLRRVTARSRSACTTWPGSHRRTWTWRCCTTTSLRS
jgi:acetyl-CoA acetyltransferase